MVLCRLHGAAGSMAVAQLRLIWLLSSGTPNRLNLPPATDAQEALDSSLEELGQTFEMKFYAPLSAGGCAGLELAARGVLGLACLGLQQPCNRAACMPTDLLPTLLFPHLCGPPLPVGKYDLQLLCMPDSWVGCDRAVPIKLKVRCLRCLVWWFS